MFHTFNLSFKTLTLCPEFPAQGMSGGIWGGIKVFRQSNYIVLTGISIKGSTIADTVDSRTVIPQKSVLLLSSFC